jgi:hypothetical protein
LRFLARLEWMPNIVNWTVAGLEAAMFAGLPQHGPHAVAGANARLAAGIAFEPNHFGTAWLNRHTLRKSQMHEKKPLLRPNKRPQSSTLSRRGSR